MQDILTSLDKLDQSLQDTTTALGEKGVEVEGLKAIDIAENVRKISAGSTDTFEVISTSTVRTGLEEGYNGDV